MIDMHVHCSQLQCGRVHVHVPESYNKLVIARATIVHAQVIGRLVMWALVSAALWLYAATVLITYVCHLHTCDNHYIKVLDQ